MKPTVLVDYQFAVASNAYVVRALLKLEGRAPTIGDRRPLNLSLVLDRSGSMQGGKLAAARDAAALLVRRLAPEDLVSVVTFDDTVATVVPPARGPEQNDAIDRIGKIVSGGCTNLSGGWLRGRELTAQNATDRHINRILLLTDGRANTGITGPEQLTGLCREAAGHGITTTTIGFGEDYDEDLLRRMADAGAGQTYYIERTDQAPGIFTEEIEGLLGLSAQNAWVEVRPGAGVLTTIHHSYPHTTEDDRIRLEIGDLYAREPRKLLLEFSLPPSAEGVEQGIAVVRIGATVLTDAGGVEQQEIVLPIVASVDRAGCQDPQIHREILFAEGARAREAALEEERRGDFESGVRRLREAAQRIRDTADPMDVELREEVLDLNAMSEAFAGRRVSGMDRKYMYQRAHNSSRSIQAKSHLISRNIGDAGGAGMQRIRYAHGDVTRPRGRGRKMIAHVVDDGGQWGSGVARSISRRWPEVEDRYRSWLGGTGGDAGPFRLGEIQITQVEPALWVASLVAKTDVPGVRHPQMDYAAFDGALARLADEALRLGVPVHMPRVGCGVAGGDWAKIEPIIDRRLSDVGVPVVVCSLPGAHTR